jgi:hypothetical protein
MLDLFSLEAVSLERTHALGLLSIEVRDSFPLLSGRALYFWKFKMWAVPLVCHTLSYGRSLYLYSIGM